jgi:hypothetical protein
MILMLVIRLAFVGRVSALIAQLNSLGAEITLEEVQVLGKHLTGWHTSPMCCGT